MTTLQALGFVRRWLWLFVLGMLLAGAASYAFSVRMPKIYEGSVKLLVVPSQTTGGPTDYNALLAAENVTTTYAELAKTRPVVNSALRSAGMAVSFEQVTGSLEATPVRNTQLLQLTTRATDPDQAAAFANAWADALMQHSQATQASRFALSRDSLTRRLDQLNADIAQRTEQIGQLGAEAPGVQRDSQMARFQIELAQLQQTYATVAHSLDDVNLSDARGADILVIADPAVPAQVPVQPQVSRNVLGAAAVGLILAVGVALLVEFLDDRLVSPQRLTHFTGLPVLGTVWQRGDDVRARVNQLLAEPASASAGQDASQAAQAFRLLMANLEFASNRRPLRTLLVTSCWAGEGKTATAANLAVVLAQAGKQVVLVDADLRAPALHDVFGLGNTSGLSSILVRDHATLASGLLRTGVAGLRLLPSGPLASDPSELLASDRMRDELARLRDTADLVIIDSPPVLEATDPAMLAGAVDGVLLVANARRTRGQDATNAVRMLRGAGAWVLGAVLNGVRERRGIYYRQTAQASGAGVLAG